MQGLDDILRKSRELSWKHLGREITFYLPGMFICDKQTGRYPAISITGSRCALDCDHCRAKILEPMIPAVTPDQLIDRCLQLEKNAAVGVLISGGCDADGRLPWQPFISAIKQIKSRTGLFISIHSGLIDFQTARALREAGVDQALIDVIGDDQTFKDIYHVNFGVSRIYDSLQALHRAGLAIVPHIVCGLHYGKIKGEKTAIQAISRVAVEQVVIVSLMRIPGTPLWESKPLKAEAVAEIIAEARFNLPHVRISLGCARQRGNTDLEVLAIDAGVNRMALPSEEAIARARQYDLQIHYQPTCCSVTKPIYETELFKE
ncbi:MAG: radical SAM protein [Thermodesulfobacteriota bacterium]